MAITNRERVGKALDFLRVGLGPFVDQVVKEQRVRPATLRRFVDDSLLDRPVTRWDVTALINVMRGLTEKNARGVFRREYPRWW